MEMPNDHFAKTPKFATNCERFEKLQAVDRLWFS